jgi:hypothetical protein
MLLQFKQNLMRKLFLLLLVCGLDFQSFAQSFFFSIDTAVKVESNGKHLFNPWAGGLNAAQFSTIDLDGNGMEDLLVFDRATNKATTYLATPNDTGYSWIHHPEYEFLFPGLEGWILLRDYDGDGLKDIFTEAALQYGGKGIRVFRNAGPPDGKPVFKLVAQELATTSFSGSVIPLTVPSGDLPSVVDTDGDGDLDVLTFELGGGFVEFHQNMSMEDTDAPDSFIFRKTSGCWGGFYEGSGCNQFEFGVACRPEEDDQTNAPEPSSVKHTGITVTAFDANGNGLMDLMIGQVHCTNMPLLINTGSRQSPAITSADTSFPSNTQKLNLYVFPAAFYEDVTFDGKKDLLVGVNTPVNEENLINFSKSAWLYENISASEAPEFAYRKENFLQSDMIDLGENANPAFADYDGDGDLDLFIGNYGQRHSDGNFYATVSLFENTGTPASPAFKLVTNDYLDLSALRYSRLKPIFTDLNVDGKVDFVLVNAYSGNTSDIKYILNTAPQNAPFQYNSSDIQRLPIEIGTEDSPAFYDVDGDGNVDVVLATSRGRLQYFQNTDSNTSPQYILAVDNFGGITDNLNKSNPKITIADMNNNGMPELIAGDRSGTLSIYPDFTADLNANFNVVTQTLYNPLQQQIQENIQSKFHLSPAVADLDGDGQPEIILGNKGGGLTFLKNMGQNPLSAPEAKSAQNLLKFYPNPTANSVNFTSGKEAKLSIYAITGQLILDDIQLQTNTSHTIDVSGFAPGVYILKFSAKNGPVQINRLLIAR